MDALDRTFDFLGQTENEAATALLLKGLEHRDRRIADGALLGLLKRKAPSAMTEIVARWHQFSDRWKQLVAERPGVLTAALKTAFGSTDEQLLRSAADAIVAVADFELTPALAAAVSDPLPLRRKLAAQATLRLAEMLHDELHSGNKRLPHDPQCVRRFVVGSLETAVGKFREHGSREVVEAFLLLVSRENAAFRHLLQDDHEAAHQAVCEQLLRSTRVGVMRLLLSLLDDAHAPLNGLKLIGQRRDVGFFRLLCRKLADDLTTAADSNLRRIDQSSWDGDEAAALVMSLSDAEQVGAVVLVQRCRMALADRLEVLEAILAEGSPAGRQAAAKAMFELYRDDCQWLVEELIEDACPAVQAEAVRHLRASGVPDAVNTLLALLENAHEEIRQAASDSLEEFRLSRFLVNLPHLTDTARAQAARIVRRVNPNLVSELQMELGAAAKGRRERALEAIAVLELAPEVEDALCEVANDADPAIRATAAELLGQCSTFGARDALRSLLSDKVGAVRSAAERSLQAICSQLAAATPQPVEVL
jgi:HEAT repeat protein